ncbi:MAG: hypothetical protein EBE86_035175 [Hormoscilla sp. GUM202]|nr:hypothetical protein [Hormoscilla sp. GM7CHS1pb]MBO1352276.1 hypothetical protein [Hormoscilla sp. GUM202]
MRSITAIARSKDRENHKVLVRGFRGIPILATAVSVISEASNTTSV